MITAQIYAVYPHILLRTGGKDHISSSAFTNSSVPVEQIIKDEQPDVKRSGRITLRKKLWGLQDATAC